MDPPASNPSNQCFRHNPPPYPPSFPSLFTTRWQGMTMARRFMPLARPTARWAEGEPTRAASPAYDSVFPYGMRQSSCHTRSSNGVPRKTSGTVNSVSIRSK